VEHIQTSGDVAMTTTRMSADPKLPHLIYGEELSRREPVTLIDVGCSGGVESHWLKFGKALRAVGFDPLTTEVDRLNALSGDAIRYEAAYVGCAEFDALFPQALRRDYIASRNNVSFERTSAAEYGRLKRRSYIKEVFNSGAEIVLTDRRIQLDDYVREAGLERVDFLKIDTDGHDVEVLLGARSILKSGVLGVSIEAQFHGADHPYANTFANIDRLMREAGFTLFDLEPYRYTRAALPGPFVHNLAAQTHNGSVQWAEAVYARDLADQNYERKNAFEPSSEDVLKLAVFLDIYGLQDCAAELFVNRRSLVAPMVEVELLLDALVRSASGAGRTYVEYMDAFHRDPDALMPGRVMPGLRTVAGLLKRRLFARM
jgi:FkbM family methyltransferase